MNEKLIEAMDHIHDGRIVHAAKAKRIKKRWFLAAVAAVLALVMFGNVPNIPLAVGARAVSLASQSRVTERPDSDDYEDMDQWRADNAVWVAQRDEREATVDTSVETLKGFFADAAAAILSDNGGENALWSPVNAYIGLAMLAEVTDNGTRQEILDLLGMEDTQALRGSVSAVWESVYKDNGDEICVLANSLWLDSELEYIQETMDILSQDYYASVYQGDLGSSKIDRALSNWLNNQTGGLLKNRTQSIQLPEESVIALASTIYFQAKWGDEFSASNNSVDTFHAPDGDVECTYMNKKLWQSDYFWGESFGAVRMGLKNGSAMWLILPDEDKTVEDVLAEGEYMDTVTQGWEWEQKKGMLINLSVPKFDVDGTIDLKEGLQALGLESVFEMDADFSSSVSSRTPVFVTGIQQSTRVRIDEEGVTAASYIVIPGAGAAEPPDEIIDFIVDRPFLFVIASSEGVPLFMGAVNQP